MNYSNKLNKFDKLIIPKIHQICPFRHRAGDQKGVVKFISRIPRALPNPPNVRLHHHAFPFVRISGEMTKMAIISGVKGISAESRGQNLKIIIYWPSVSGQSDCWTIHQ